MSINNTPEVMIDDYKVLKKNESFVISYNLDRDIAIKDLKTEGLAYDQYEVKDNELVITFKAPSETGLYFIYLDYFDYEVVVNDIKVKTRYYLGDEYWYSIEKNEPVISNISFLDDLSFSFDLIDEDDTARLIEFELISANANYLFNIPLGTNVITFSDLPKGDYELVASLVYDRTNVSGMKIKLFNYGVRIDSDLSFGEIKVSKENNRYTKVRIIINDDFLKSSVNEISYNKEVLYSHSESSKNDLMMYSIVGFVLTLVVGIIIRSLIKKTKRKNELDICSEEK